MADASRRLPKLTVIGVHSATDAYPNTKYTIAGLRERFEVEEINVPMLAGVGGGDRLIRWPLSGIFRALWAHACVLVRAVPRLRSERVYVPYPGVLLMLAWSMLPVMLRPRHIVMDAFISWYDTIVNDRGYLAREGVLACMLRWAERRAFRAADVVVVDTAQNADYYAELLSLPPALFVSIPLATNEVDFSPAPLRRSDGTCRVLFVGTLIPLHGIEVIIEAARMLVHRRDIRFVLVGDGQERSKIASAVDQLENVDWQKEWKDADALAEMIREADICLGIFGTTAKAQRVCPYKIYAYASVGRPVITARTCWLESASKSFGSHPFECVPAGDSQALASAILLLAADESGRKRLADTARRFYVEILSNARALEKLSICLKSAST